jgi:hypothetical protein
MKKNVLFSGSMILNHDVLLVGTIDGRVAQYSFDSDGQVSLARRNQSNNNDEDDDLLLETKADGAVASMACSRSTTLIGTSDGNIAQLDSAGHLIARYSLGSGSITTLSLASSAQSEYAVGGNSLGFVFAIDLQRRTRLWKLRAVDERNFGRTSTCAAGRSGLARGFDPRVRCSLSTRLGRRCYTLFGCGDGSIRYFGVARQSFAVRLPDAADALANDMCTGRFDVAHDRKCVAVACANGQVFLLDEQHTLRPIIDTAHGIDRVCRLRQPNDANDVLLCSGTWNGIKAFRCGQPLWSVNTTDWILSMSLSDTHLYALQLSSIQSFALNDIVQHQVVGVKDDQVDQDQVDGVEDDQVDDDQVDDVQSSSSSSSSIY